MKEINIYGENRHRQHTKMREACRGIVIEGDNILLSYEVNTDQWLIPGGGVENNETLRECCARELAEETGCVVKAETPFLTINEFYEDWLYVNHYCVCQRVGQTQRNLTEMETENGLEPRWISFDEAAAIFAQYQVYAGENELRRGAYLREHQALLAYKAQK